MKKTYILLHLLMFLYSLSPICSKLAGMHPVLSRPFIFYYACVLFLLAVYAFCWQKVIKRLPLTVAYANKAVTVVWGMIWGVLIFQETVSFQRVLGAVIIIAGVILYASSHKAEGETSHA